MKKDNYITLIYKALKGEASSTEKVELKAWLDESNDNKARKNTIEEGWAQSNDYEPELSIDIDADFQQLQQRIRSHKKQEQEGAIIRPMNNRRQWLSIAAAITLAITAGWWFFSNNSTSPEMLLAETIIGEKTSIILADGSQVWLNEGSQLRFPGKFSATQRKVYLDGEGFFDIKKNPNAPFVIETPLASVNVLGTSFNLNARPNTQQVSVSVVTGKVRLQSTKTEESITLEVGEKGIFDGAENTLQKSKSTPPNEYAWQSGVLTFKDEALNAVIKEIGQLFGAEISIKNAAMQQCLFTGRLQEETLESALKTIADNFQMTIEQKGDTIFELSSGVCE